MKGADRRSGLPNAKSNEPALITSARVDVMAPSDGSCQTEAGLFTSVGPLEEANAARKNMASPWPMRTNCTRKGPLRICMLSSKFYAASDMGGGLERSARRLFEYLLAEGHQVVTLTRNYDGLRHREVIHGVTVYRFPIWGRSRILISLSYLVQALWWLVRNQRSYDLIHCHQSYAPAAIGTLARGIVRKPVLVKLSTVDEFSEVNELQQLPLFPVRRWLLKRVDRFVAVHPRACDEFARLGINPSKILHIPNGVKIPSEAAFHPETRQAARARLRLFAGQIAVFVGRLSSEKNLDVLLQTWRHVLRSYPDAQLLLVGDGGTFRNVEADLRRQVRELRLDRQVLFVGRVAQVLEYLLAADLFVLPSQTEGMSNALLEAMAAGLPIVATRIPGNEALIDDGKNGILVERRNPERLGRAILHLFSSPGEAQRMGRAARQTAEARFAIERVGSTYLSLYRELLNGRVAQ